MGEQAHLTPEDIIARIDDWKGHDVRYEELGGGITNHNYIVWVDGGPENGGKKYVMRVPGIGTDMFIDRDVERDCMIQAAKAGVGPAVAYQIDPEGALVIDFVEGEIMHPETMAGHPERIKQVVETVKVFHDKARLQERDPALRHAAQVHQDRARHQRADAGAPRGDAAWPWRTIETATQREPRPRRRLPQRPALARTSSSTPTARCGSSTGSTAA